MPAAAIQSCSKLNEPSNNRNNKNQAQNYSGTSQNSNYVIILLYTEFSVVEIRLFWSELA